MFLHKKYNAWIRNILNQLNQEIIRNELQICASAYYNKLNYVKQVLSAGAQVTKDQGQIEAIAAYMYLTDAINMRRLNGLVTTQYLTVLVVAANCTADDSQSRDQINFKNYVSIITGFLGYKFDANNSYIYGPITPFEPVKTAQNLGDDFIKICRDQLNNLYQSGDGIKANDFLDNVIARSNNLGQIANELLRDRGYAKVCAESGLGCYYNEMYSDYLRYGSTTDKTGIKDFNKSDIIINEFSSKTKKQKRNRSQGCGYTERHEASYSSGCGQSQPVVLTSGCGQTSRSQRNHSSGCGQTSGYSSGCGQSQPVVLTSGCGQTSRPQRNYSSGCGQTSGYRSNYSSGCGGSVSYSQGC